MAPARLLDRNVRSRLGKNQEDDEDGESIGSDGSASENEEDVSDESSLSDDEIHGPNGQDGMGTDVSEEVELPEQISNVSFRALKQAQDALSKKRKHGSDTTADHEQKLETLRARLRQIKEQSGASLKEKRKDQRDVARSRSTAKVSTVDDDVDGEEDEDEEDSDSATSEEAAGSKSRSSKHAPTTQSAKHQVTRKRTVVNVPKRPTRDPRFDALHQTSSHHGNNTDKAYSFLLDYQKSEIAELQAAIKTTRDENDKETLKRKVVSMENRIKAQEAKDREQGVVRRHRREEQERVKEGKKPFYLKRKHVKEQALVEKFKGMKGKEREKLLDKRRKKEGQKEKKRMPEARRLVG